MADDSAQDKSLAPTGDGGIALRAEGNHLGTKWSVVATTAPLVGSLLAAAAFAAELIWLKPMTNAQHFMLAIFTGVVGGTFLGMWNSLGRLQEARGTIEYQRKEMARMAESRTKIEEAFLRKRLSSEGKGGKSASKKG